jgi:hypothetical protein
VQQLDTVSFKVSLQYANLLWIYTLHGNCMLLLLDVFGIIGRLCFFFLFFLIFLCKFLRDGCSLLCVSVCTHVSDGLRILLSSLVWCQFNLWLTWSGCRWGSGSQPQWLHTFSYACAALATAATAAGILIICVFVEPTGNLRLTLHVSCLIWESHYIVLSSFFSFLNRYRFEAKFHITTCHLPLSHSCKRCIRGILANCLFVRNGLY